MNTTTQGRAPASSSEMSPSRKLPSGRLIRTKGPESPEKMPRMSLTKTSSMKGGVA